MGSHTEPSESAGSFDRSAQGPMLPEEVFISSGVGDNRIASATVVAENGHGTSELQAEASHNRSITI